MDKKMNVLKVQKHYHNYRPVVIPAIYIIISYFLAFFIPRINYNLFPWLVSPLSSTVIIPFLSSIASGMIALTGIVFSLAFVLQQFITSTYSPRIVQVTGRGIQPHSIGIFTATFIFCLIVLRSVKVDDTDPNGSFILWVAFLWLLASVIMLILLILRVGDLSIVRILFFLEEAGMQAIEKIYPKAADSSPVKSESIKIPLSNTVPVIYNGETQYIAGYSTNKLLSLACKYDAVIYISLSTGDCITDGDQIFHIKGGPIPRKDLFNSININWERILKDDPRYSIRLLVDVAIRALSPAVNDPTTAVQSLDHLENLLKKLVNSNLAVGIINDSKSNVSVA
jgi:uncharacterized membrane protein